MMSRRKRALILTLLALAVPLPAYAITNEVLAAPAGPSSISVSASLASCGVIDDGVACQINVSFSEVANASSYTATVTRADGSVIDYGAIGAGGASIWVPYVGAGTYSVKVTAYGEPETATDPDGHGEIIATGYSRGSQANGETSETANGDPQELETDAGSRNPGAGVNADADGVATIDAQSADPGTAETTTPTPDTTTTTTCTPPVATAPAPTPPVEPPADTEPDNPDEDADGIPDEQERATYEQQLAEYQAALADQQAPTGGDC